MFGGDLADAAALAAVRDGDAGAARRPARVVLRPVRPMLAGTALDDVAAALAKDGPAALERKLDGIRIQIHRDGDVVRVFTRSLERSPTRLPEIGRAGPCAPRAAPPCSTARRWRSTDDGRPRRSRTP